MSPCSPRWCPLSMQLGRNDRQASCELRRALGREDPCLCLALASPPAAYELSTSRPELHIFTSVAHLIWNYSKIAASRLPRFSHLLVSSALASSITCFASCGDDITSEPRHPLDPVAISTVVSILAKKMRRFGAWLAFLWPAIRQELIDE